VRLRREVVRLGGEAAEGGAGAERPLLALEGDERLVGHVLLGLLEALAAPLADRIAVGLLLEDARERLGEVAVLEAGRPRLDRARQHLLAFVGCLVEAHCVEI